MYKNYLQNILSQPPVPFPKVVIIAVFLLFIDPDLNYLNPADFSVCL